MAGSRADFRSILRLLAEHEVDSIVVGGVCAVIQGAPIHTFDVDIVPDCEPSNLDRLARALTSLEAWYREHPRGKIRPDRAKLDQAGFHLLMTRFGPLDLLPEIGTRLTYQDLMPDTDWFHMGNNLLVRVLKLEMLIAIKTQLGREKDRLVLSTLRQVLKERDS